MEGRRSASLRKRPDRDDRDPDGRPAADEKERPDQAGRAAAGRDAQHGAGGRSAEQKRPASDDEAGQADRPANSEQYEAGRHRPGHIRRIRDNNDRMRADGAGLPNDGAGS